LNQVDNKKVTPKALGIYQDEFDNLRQAFRVKVKVSKDLIQENPLLKNVKEIDADPTPETTEEAYKLLTDYYAPMQCAVYKYIGLNKYRTWNTASLEAEISRLDEFRTKAGALDYHEVVANKSTGFPESDDYIYLKLINDFYRNAPIDSLLGYNNTRQAQVYGQYILYFEWLKDQLAILIGDEKKSRVQIDNHDQLNSEEKPSLTAYAIMHHYLDSPVTKTNSNKFADEYGFKSGDALYNKYRRWRDDSNRLLNSENKASNNKRIANFKQALKLLETRDNKAFKAAERDLKKLTGEK
jgi:hypothetical protein